MAEVYWNIRTRGLVLQAARVRSNNYWIWIVDVVDWEVEKVVSRQRRLASSPQRLGCSGVGCFGAQLFYIKS